jgi:DNA polymerase I
MIKGKKYKGAIVVEPVSGIHFNVVVVDFQSLYPSVIKYHNIGYSTINCKHPECFENKVAGTSHHICTKSLAMESVLIGSLKDLRVVIYKSKSKNKELSPEEQAWYSVVEQTVKVIMNASYGVFGYDGYELYCPPVAESIAAISRFDTANVIGEAKNLNIMVLYGDTDSTFLKQPSTEQINTLIKWASDNLHMDLAIDKKYRYVCLSNRKKNYFGVFEDEVGKDGKIKKGDVDVKGLTAKKKHTPKIIKKAFLEVKDVLRNIYKEEEFPEAKIKITKIVKHTYNTLKRREWENLSDLSLTMSLGNTLEGYTKNIPQHVQAALQLKEAGETVKKGEEIEFVKVCKPKESSKKKRLMTKLNGGKTPKSKHYSSRPVKLIKTNDEVNVEAYIRFLKNTFKQILEALDIEWDSEIEGITRVQQYL